MAYEIPTEGRIPFLDTVIPIHWENHAALMFVVWFVLVPAAVMMLRFGKIEPQLYGIPRGTPKLGRGELCWTLHFVLLYIAISASVAGALLVTILSGGFSGTLHAWFGSATVVLGALQVISGWLRGSHGGRKAEHADPEDRSTWGGDHFDMSPRRRWFEAYHKTAGYFAMAMAVAAVTTGLAQYWIPWVAWALFVVILAGLLLAVYLEGTGRNHDTYHSVYGFHPEHPFNRRRLKDAVAALNEKP